jgi:hypothetical protein
VRPVLSLLLVLAAVSTAQAEPITAAGSAKLGRVITAPSAWMAEEGAVMTTAQLDHRLDGGAGVAVGLGGIAELSLDTNTDPRFCMACGEKEEPSWFGRAGFRVGWREDTWVRGMPALVLGFRKTFASNAPLDDARLAEVHLVASRGLGPIRVHAGGTLTAAGNTDSQGAFAELTPRARPLGGLEWTPSQYPRTTLLGDIAWVTRFEDGKDPDLEWVAGWGVRYQALRWSSVELLVRHREGEGLGDSTVMIRVNAALDRYR